MRVSTLVNAVREDSAKYPNLSQMPLHLYNDEDELNLEGYAVFVEDLFANNAYERTRFINALGYLERNADTHCFLRAKITESHVILFYRTAYAKIFSRKEHPGAFDSGN